MERICAGLLCIGVIMLVLIGCTVKKKDIILKVEGMDVKISSIYEDAYSKDVIVTGKSEAGEKKYKFDTEEEKLTTYEEKATQKEKYRIVSNNLGVLQVIDNDLNELVYEMDLKSQGFIEDKGKYTSGTILSPTERYLLIVQNSTKKSILLDLKDKKQINIPIDGFIMLEWANNDKQVILKRILNFSGRKEDIETYIWHFPGSEIEKIGEEFKQKLVWSPNGKHLYYVTTKRTDDKNGYAVMLYNNKAWKEVYFTERSINENTLRWISDNAFIFTVHATTNTKNPIKGYLRPEEYFAVKLDYRKKKETVKKLEGIFISSYAWSYNNKFIYYVDNNKFCKAEVNFAEK